MLFGLPYETAIFLVGAVMICYVLFGGMLATTWVQIIKAVLLLSGATVMVGLALSPLRLRRDGAFRHRRRHLRRRGAFPRGPGGQSLWDAVSLGIALMFGTAGLPHILMRFYTVPDAKAARKSVFYATGLIGYFYILTFIIGFAAMVLVGRDVVAGVDKGGNMAALLLAEVTGGTVFLGFIAAVAFATILAVVAGLTLAGATTLSHDLYVNVFRSGRSSEEDEVKVAKRATVGLGVVAVLLGLAFKGQNVAFMVGLAFAIAASANFPALLLSILWKGTSTCGAVASIVTGTVTAVGLILISPTVWVDVLGNAAPIFPWKNPALVSMPAAFLAGYLGSVLVPDAKAQSLYAAQQIRNYLGVGAE